MRKLKVCILTNIPAPYRVDFFNHLIESNNDLTFEIIYTAQQEDNRGWNLDTNKFKNSHFIKSRTIKIKKELDYKHIHISTDILKKLKEINPDILIASEYNPSSILAFLWCKINKVKFISWSDGTLHSEKSINIFQRIVRNIICKYSNACIASSSKTKEAQKYYGANERKIFISYLTVNLEDYLFNRTNIDSNNLLFVGRLSKCKGVDLLLKSLSLVDEDYNLIIVGDGEERENLETLADTLKISDKVEFVGSKNGKHLNFYYQNSGIFILPSLCDCFGLVLTEAMCNELVIISSKYADGAYDLVIEGENGYIIDPKNTDEFAKTIKLLLNNPIKCLEMGKKSGEYVQSFDFEKVKKGIYDAIDYSIGGDKS